MCCEAARVPVEAVMAKLVEITAQLVAAHARKTRLTREQLIKEIGRVHTALTELQRAQEGVGDAKPLLMIGDAFKMHEVVCLLCGKGGFQTLTRHLGHAHQMKPRAYRKRFGIPAEQPLSSKSFSDSRKQLALELGLADNLVKAREVRLAKIRVKKNAAQFQPLL